jgi:hypothetical protein
VERERPRRSLGIGLRILLFPWGIWSLAGLLPRALRRRSSGAVSAVLTRGLHALLYVGLGIPLTIFVGGEILISGNEWLIGEQADYRLQSDFEAAPRTAIEVPGPRGAPPSTVIRASTDAYRKHLVALYSPVIVQKVAHRPEWDIPLRLDFDGNADPRDNVQNEPRFRPHTAAIHGELTAETEDSYYLTYSLYHVKDYDHPLRELLTDWTFHDSDNEGLMVRVDRRTLEVVELETWFHNRFLLYNLSGTSSGTEPVHGKVHVEEKTHVLIYSQPQGHGVRGFQSIDVDALRGNVKILRHRGSRPAVPVRADRTVQLDATYDLVSFDDWYAQARGPFGTEGRGKALFEESIPLGRLPNGEELRIGRYIAGYDYSKVGWSRPKPPWSWDDGWDQIPIFVWHFLPSYAFSSHGGSRLSHRYLYNHPLEKTFGAVARDVVPSLDLGVEFRSGEKWASLEGRGGDLAHATYWKAIQSLLKGYVNYLFHALG